MSTLAGKDPEKLDWFEMYPEPFFGGTEDFDAVQLGAYALVLFLIYASRQGRLADEPQKTARKLKLSTRKWNEVRQFLIEKDKIQEVDGFLVNRRASAYFEAKLPKVVENRRKIVEKARDKHGEKQGEKRGDKSKAPQQQGLGLPENPKKGLYARAQEVELEKEEGVDTLGDVIIAVAKIAEVLKVERPGRYWSADYRRLREEGLEFEDILEAAKAHRGDPIKSLTAIRGLAKAKQAQRVRGGRNAAPAPREDRPVNATAITDKDWEFGLVLLLKNGGWNEPKLGPPPTRAGCLCPAHLVKGWLAMWKLQGCHPVQEYDEGTNLVDYPADRPDDFMRAMWMPDGKGAA